jgi:hypothetical protein
VYLRSRVRKLERSAEVEMISIPQRDGTLARFPESMFLEAIVHMFTRSRALKNGEELPPHPLAAALANARDLQALVPVHGTCVYQVAHAADHPNLTDAGFPTTELSETRR